MRIRLINSVLVIILSNFLAHGLYAKVDKLPKGMIETKTQAAPLFTVKDIDGNSFTLKDVKGQWVFLHFWATWCGPCRKEIPEIQRLTKTDISKKLKIVLVNTGENEDTIFTFLSEFAPDLKTYMDSDGLITESYSPRGLPATYLINPQGKILYQALGGMHWTQPAYYQFLQSLVNTP